MRRDEFNRLVLTYGSEKANRALAWFVDNHSPAFRASLKADRYCQDNEFLWF